MNGKELIEAIADNSNEGRYDASVFLGRMTAEIRAALGRGEDVVIAGLGTFRSEVRGPMKCRNPRTGEAVISPEKTVARFRPAKALRDRLNGG